ncbi:MAG: hypothetical protein R3F46_07285 [bacterium]
MQRSDSSRTRWEYLRVQVENTKIKASDETLAELGQQGWELSGVVESGNSYIHFWFRRELR